MGNNYLCKVLSSNSIIRIFRQSAVLVYLLVAFLLPSCVLHAQNPTNQDCLGAIPVCDWTFTSTQAPNGSGNYPAEVNSSISCLGNGEQNSVWYTFTTQSAGNISFTITPDNPLNDYDWAVFNLTNAPCSEIFTNPNLLVACSFNPVPGPTGPNGGPNPQDEAVIPAQANETYAVVITIFSQGGQGYTLDFLASTSQIFDNIPPVMDEVLQPIRCNTDTITLRFNENVNCNNINTNTFVLTGPGGTHQITSVTSPNCSAGAPYSTTYTLHVSPPLTVNGQYSIALASNVNDACGNASTPGNATPLLFDYFGLIVDSTFSTMADCLQNNGSAGIAITGGVLPLNYNWSPGGQTTPIANNLYAGNYTVTVVDQNNCSVTETVSVLNPINFSVYFDQIPDTCEKGNGIVTVGATGTSGPFAYLWNAPINSTIPTQYSLTGNDAYTVSVTDVDGCVLNDTVIVDNISNDTLVAAFSATPNPVDILFPQTKLVNQSQNYVTYKWEYLSEVVTNVINPVIELPDWGDYPVSLYVYDINGCADTSTQKIMVRGDVYYYIPNAFTPDENNLNEHWYPRGVGFDKKTYKMTICDRWGNIMYQSHDTDFGWNGNDRKGQPCPPDIYTYKITLEGYEGMLPVFHGSIMLIR